MNEAWGLLVFLGSGLAFLLAAAGLANRRMPGLLVALQALIGALLLEFFFTHALGFTADMETHPLQTEAFLFVRCAKYSLGPLFHAFYQRLTTYRAVDLRSMAPHFVPQGLAWLLSLAYMVAALSGSPHFSALRLLMGICTDASLVHLLAYVVLTLLSSRSAGDPRIRTGALAVGGVTVSVVGMLALYVATGWKSLEIGSQIVLALSVVLFFLLLQAQPESLTHFGSQARRRAYQRSTLAGVDTDLLELRLKELMEQELVFHDELLSLESLAEKLCIPRNRLSEFLNGVLGTPFNAYVNRYRIEEVKRRLLEEPTSSILALAYAAGFNSKSVFYEAFKRFTGTTPQEFRGR